MKEEDKIYTKIIVEYICNLKVGALIVSLVAFGAFLKGTYVHKFDQISNNEGFALN